MHYRHDELERQFPDKISRINALRIKDAEFRQLCDSYDRLARAIDRRATDAVTTDRRQIEKLRQTRQILREAIADSLA